jgi:hypothetical protein
MLPTENRIPENPVLNTAEGGKHGGAGRGIGKKGKTAHPTTQTIGTGFPVKPDTQMIIEEKESLN